MAAPHQSLESFFEVFVEDGVDKRIDQGVDVAQPRQKVSHLHRRVAGVARIDDHLLHEKRQPADDERPDDQAQRVRGLALARARDARPLAELAPPGLAARLEPPGLEPPRLALEGLFGSAPPLSGGLLGGGVGGLLRRGQGLGAPGPAVDIPVSGGVGGRDHASVGHAGVAAGPAGLPPHVEGLSSPVDFIIEDEDEQQGDVKGSEGGVQGEGDVMMDDDALVLLLRILCEVPPQQRGQRDEDGQEPHHGHHLPGPGARPLAGVLHRVRDGPVAVDGDGGEVEDGARAAGDVDAQPDGAHHLTHEPGLLLDVHDAEGHDQHGDQQVGHGERADEVVGRVVQLASDRDGGDHQAVEECGQDGHDEEGHGEQDLTGWEFRALQRVVTTAVGKHPLSEIEEIHSVRKRRTRHKGGVFGDK